MRVFDETLRRYQRFYDGTSREVTWRSLYQQDVAVRQLVPKQTPES